VQGTFALEISPDGFGVVNFDGSGSLTLTDTVSSGGKVALPTRCQQLRPPLFCETKAGDYPEIPTLVSSQSQTRRDHARQDFIVFPLDEKLEAILVFFNLEGGCLHGLLARVRRVIAFH